MTELIWDGKYDKATGKKIAPPRIALPFQDIETVNESTADRDRNLSLFGGGKSSEWRNRLIWGDKRYVLPSLLPEFAGKVNLIYIDPPFDTGANFSYLATIPDAPSSTQHAARSTQIKPLTSLAGNDEPDLEETEASSSLGMGGTGLSFVKEPSMIEQKAYRDTWGRGLDSYLKWFYETVVLLRELLADDGCIYVHLDWHVSHYAKAVLDEVLSDANFKNEIIWKRQTAKAGSYERLAQYGRIHEVIYFYSKTENCIWHQQFTNYSQEHIEGSYKNIDEHGRQYSLRDLTAAGVRRGDSGKPITIKGNSINLPSGRHWAVGIQSGETVQQAVDRLVQENKIWYQAGKAPRLKLYLHEMRGVPLQSLWTDIPPVQSQSAERLDYPTQKPEALLERIIKASSNEGGLVLDCFCGSGTTAAVAEKLGRRWITCDLGRFAIHTARKRLLGIEHVKPFVVQNLGKYERQQWQKAEFGDDAEAVTRSYREFILTLYKARPITGTIWLHGLKNGHMVHVGGVDAPISVGDVAQVVAEFKRSRGTGSDAPTQNSVDLLGWDFAFELNEVAKQQAALNGVDVKFVRIPREVLEKKAVEQGDIKFFELAALSVDYKVTGKNVMLTLKDFVIPLDDVPQEIQSAITHWEQWIDYWAVDWDNKGDTFHNQWQSYRTRQSKTIQRQINSPQGIYDTPGEYRVVVKVIDILGNDTTKTLMVKIV